MLIFGYLRASTSGQDATRAKDALKKFARQHQHRIAGWYVDNVSGTTMNRPELLRLLDDAGWDTLRKQIADKQLAVVSLDLPTSHLALTSVASDEFTRSMLKAINGMMLDMLAAIARKDYEDRRRRQAEGIRKAKAEGKYRGRVADAQKHELIRTLRLGHGKSLRETARLAGVSKMTVIRVCSDAEE